jgi:predicted HTH transcriptional regulator
VKKGAWTFISNHGHMVEFLAKNPHSTTQEIAQMIGLSIAGVQKIIADLEREGYLTIVKAGRCNQYIVHTDQPMRHPLDRDHIVGDVFKSLG